MIWRAGRAARPVDADRRGPKVDGGLDAGCGGLGAGGRAVGKRGLGRIPELSHARKRRLAPPSDFAERSPRLPARATQGIGNERNQADGCRKPQGGVGLGTELFFTHGGNLKSDGCSVSLNCVSSWTRGCWVARGRISTSKPCRLPTVHIIGSAHAKLKSFFPTIVIEKKAPGTGPAPLWRPRARDAVRVGAARAKCLGDQPGPQGKDR
jgi:hypothetical protein